MSNLEELERRIKIETDKYQGLPIALSGGVDSSLLAALIKPEFAVSVQLPSDTHNEIQYSKKVAEHLGIEHLIIVPDDSKFDEYLAKAVKAIGRPIPHFNIFPLYCMYKELAEKGVKELILGDGPDETMSGYARNLIMAYLYKVADFPAFGPYQESIKKVLPPPNLAYSLLTGKTEEQIEACVVAGDNAVKAMNRVDIALMRPDMDDMSNKIAEHFGIKNIRPYQDNPELDDFMLNLPTEDKIYDVEFGKYLLRQIAAKYLPEEIAWRKVKVGGPVYPVNVIKKWLGLGEFDKTVYLAEQEKILSNVWAHLDNSNSSR